jgi:hypothetical protein
VTDTETRLSHRSPPAMRLPERPRRTRRPVPAARIRARPPELRPRVRPPVRTRRRHLRPGLRLRQPIGSADPVACRDPQPVLVVDDPGEARVGPVHVRAELRRRERWPRVDGRGDGEK